LAALAEALERTMRPRIRNPSDEGDATITVEEREVIPFVDDFGEAWTLSRAVLGCCRIKAVGELPGDIPQPLAAVDTTLDALGERAADRPQVTCFESPRHRDQVLDPHGRQRCTRCP
jgi:hypothetical protein